MDNTGFCERIFVRYGLTLRQFHKGEAIAQWLHDRSPFRSLAPQCGFGFIAPYPQGEHIYFWGSAGINDHR